MNKSHQDTVISSPDKLAREIANDIMADEKEIAEAIRQACAQAFRSGYNAACARFGHDDALLDDDK